MGVWNKINKPGQTLELVISMPPHLDRFVVNADLRNVRPIKDPEGIALGIQFRTMEPKRSGVLRLALLKLATERIRTARPKTPTETEKLKAIETSSGTPAVPELGPLSPGTKIIDPAAPARAAELAAAPQGKKTEKANRKYLGSNATKYWLDPYHGKRIGDVLVHMGKLTQQQVEVLVEESRQAQERFGQFLVKHNFVTGPEIMRALSLTTGIPTTDLSDITIRRTFREIFPVELMRRYEFIPFDANEKVVCIATGSPFPDPVLAEIRDNTKKRVEVFLADEGQVLNLLNKTTEDVAEETSTLRNRRFPRFNMPLPATYYFCTSHGERLEDLTYSGQTMNISEGGFRVEGPRADLGSFGNIQNYGLYVQLSVKFQPHEFTALCRPVFVYEKETVSEVKYPFEMGLAIMDISATSKQQLNNILEIVKKLTNPTSV